MDIPPPDTQPQQPLHLTRRERREQRRAELRAAQKGFVRRRTAWRVLTWVAALAVVTGLGWGMVQLANRVPAASSGDGLTVPAGEQENSKGPADARLTVVEYSDFQCPACAAYQALIEQALNEPELKGKVRLVYRHFPLTSIHQNALQAAHAAQAAAVQGKFWEMHDLLFKEQSAWSKLPASEAGEKFLGYASSLGLDAEQWKRDRDSSAVKEKVAADIAGGSDSRVDATPTFFLNGVKMPSPKSYDEFKQQMLDTLNALP